MPPVMPNAPDRSRALRSFRRHDLVCRQLVVAVATASVAWLPVASAGCGHDEALVGAGGPSANLEALTKVSWIVDADPPSFAQPSQPVSLPNGGSLAERAVSFLESVGPALRMRSAKDDYVLQEELASADGRKVVRLQQTAFGVVIENGFWTLHLDKSERVTAMSGHYVQSVDAAVATLTPEAARKAALDAYERMSPSDLDAKTVQVLPTLVYIPTAEKARLAYAVTVRPANRFAPGTSYRLDAVTADVLASWSNSSGAESAHLAGGHGAKHYPPFDKFEKNATLPLRSFPVSASVAPAELSGSLDLGGTLVNIETRALSYATNPAELLPIATTSRGALTPWLDGIKPLGVAIDAQANASVVAKFYASLERGGKPYLSHDGKGSPLVSIVNVSARDVPTGAMWSIDDHQMFYSDTNPSGQAGQGYYPIAASLETVAHEVGHGVSAATWRKTRSAELQPGAIDESMSDVFAAFVSHRTSPDERTDFLFSEDDNALGHPWRSLAYPKQRSLIEPDGPVHCDFMAEVAEGKCEAEVHRMAGITNHAFYLMTHGGLSAHVFEDPSERYRVNIPCGIGWDNALRLYWTLVSERMDGGETFHRLAFDSLGAAKDLGVPTGAVACAWVAVGVLSSEEARPWATCEKVPETAKKGAPADLFVAASGGVRLLQTGPLRLLCPASSLLLQ